MIRKIKHAVVYLTFVSIVIMIGSPPCTDGPPSRVYYLVFGRSFNVDIGGLVLQILGVVGGLLVTAHAGTKVVVNN